MSDDLVARLERRAQAWREWFEDQTPAAELDAAAARIRELEAELANERARSRTLANAGISEQERAERAEAERDALRALLGDVEVELRRYDLVGSRYWLTVHIPAELGKRIDAALAGRE